MDTRLYDLQDGRTLRDGIIAAMDAGDLRGFVRERQATPDIAVDVLVGEAGLILNFVPNIGLRITALNVARLPNDGASLEACFDQNTDPIPGSPRLCVANRELVWQIDECPSRNTHAATADEILSLIRRAIGVIHAVRRSIGIHVLMTYAMIPRQDAEALLTASENLLK